MTPAVDTARKAQIDYEIHSYEHDAASESYGLEAAEKLAVPAARVFKTLVAQLDGKSLIVGIIPVEARLDLKALARVAEGKKATMAEHALVERTTGYVLGGVSPLGQKKRLPTFLDISAEEHDTIHVSAGRRGLEIELAPADLLALTHGSLANLSR